MRDTASYGVRWLKQCLGVPKNVSRGPKMGVVLSKYVLCDPEVYASSGASGIDLILTILWFYMWKYILIMSSIHFYTLWVDFWGFEGPQTLFLSSGYPFWGLGPLWKHINHTFWGFEPQNCIKMYRFPYKTDTKCMVFNHLGQGY